MWLGRPDRHLPFPDNGSASAPGLANQESELGQDAPENGQVLREDCRTAAEDMTFQSGFKKVCRVRGKPNATPSFILIPCFP
jgi:hypothetical protein